MTYTCPFRDRQIVVVAEFPKGFESSYPFKTGDCLLFLGEIAQMPGHCIVVDKKGRVHWGYHTDNFREPLEDEI